MNFSSINFDSWRKLFLSLKADSDLMKMHCSCCITILGYTARGKKIEKYFEKYFIRTLSIRTLSTLSMRMLHIAYEDSIWLQLIYFISFFDRWGQCKLTNTECQLKILLCVVFIAQISHCGKFAALHKLISIVLQLTNKIK